MSTTATSKNVKGILASALLAFAALAVALVPSIPQNAEAALVSQNIETFVLKGEPSTIQLVGSGNYDDWHYVIMSQPKYGYIPAYDGETGQVFYQPPANNDGVVDSFTYRIAKDANPSAWYSPTATVKIALVLPWADFYNEQVTPVLMSSYVKAKGLNASTVNTEPGVSNIEPYKATPDGAARYSNVKAAYELSGQSWWSLSLGQKMWLMENLPYKTAQWAGVYYQ